ncbi:MAG: hypothetical protein M3209_20875 [Acidobacteriota bacterium]|nr:hypothetical protein [Acidobacteriota bacterium]
MKADLLQFTGKRRSINLPLSETKSIVSLAEEVVPLAKETIPRAGDKIFPTVNAVSPTGNILSLTGDVLSLMCGTGNFHINGLDWLLNFYLLFTIFRIASNRIKNLENIHL